MKQFLLAIVIVAGVCQGSVREEALQEWSSMKFGLFIHWGIYSIPAGMWNGEQIEKLGEQIQRHAKIPHDEYAALAGQFNPVNFDADAIAALAKKAGMRYIVLTAKHHDGFCMFASEHTDFDIIDATPYKKDILGELAEACRRHGSRRRVSHRNPESDFYAKNTFGRGIIYRAHASGEKEVTYFASHGFQKRDKSRFL